MSQYVFICHAAEDKAVATAICKALEADGIPCWIAPRNIKPGADSGDAISKAIGEARALLLVRSSHSNESEQVKREVEQAASRGVGVIPFRIENVPPSEALGHFISTSQGVDAFTPPLEKHVDYLVKNLINLVPPVAKPEKVYEQEKAYEPEPPPPVEKQEKVYEPKQERVYEPKQEKVYEPQPPPPPQPTSPPAKSWFFRVPGLVTIAAAVVLVGAGLLGGLYLAGKPTKPPTEYTKPVEPPTEPPQVQVPPQQQVPPATQSAGEKRELPPSHYIIVTTFKVKQAADDKVQELRSKGYNSSEVIRSKKGYYRVSLGKYSSLDVAQEKQREAIAEGYIPVDAWIVPREKARD